MAEIAGDISEGFTDEKGLFDQKCLVFQAESCNLEHPENDYVKLKIETGNDRCNFKIKEEVHKDDSDSEDSGGDIDKNELNENSEYYSRLFVKSYTSVVVKEEPVENVKCIFKESPLEFEKQKYHQGIFEQIVEKFSNIKLKDLQALYMTMLREVANVEIFTCSLCNYQTMNKINLNCHFVVMHNGKTEQEMFKCKKCDYSINFQSRIIRHAIKHKQVKIRTKKTREKYPCSQCNYTARTEDALHRHSSIHKENIKCDLCQFQSKDRIILKEHKDTHKIGTYFQCYKCDYKNGNKLTLALHLLKKHEIESEATKRSKICEICSFAAVDRNKLRLHYITHKTVKDLKEDEIFNCPEPGCNHRTKLKAHLRVHMKSHLPPEFICDVCGFGTRKKSSYANHLTTHQRLSEIKWIHCSICPYKCRNNSLLNQHIRKGIHSDKFLRHIRNRDRIREADEKGMPVKIKRCEKRTVKVLVGEEALLYEKKTRSVRDSNNPKKKCRSKFKDNLNTETIPQIKTGASTISTTNVQSQMGSHQTNL